MGSFSKLSWALVSVVVAALVAGCVQSPDEAQFQVRDSLGIEIVEHPEATTEPAGHWSLRADPVFKVGEAASSSEFELFNVVATVKLGSERVAVALGSLNEIRFFDLDGGYQGSVGQEGGGPGEFQTILGMWPLEGDSLAVFDYGNARITVLTSAGVLVRVFHLEQVPGRPLPLPVAPFRDGSFLGRAHMLGAEEGWTEGVRRGQVLFVRWSSIGEFVDTLVVRPDGERYYRSLNGRPMMASPPFSREFAVTVHGQDWYYGAMDRYEIEKFSGGRLTRVIRGMAEPRMVTSEERDAWAEWAEERWARLPPEVLAWRLAMPFPETLPAHDDIVADSEGNLWVARYALPGEAQTWDVYGPEGRLIARVATPAGGTVMEIGPDYVLGVWSDEVEVEQVRMYRLTKSE